MTNDATVKFPDIVIRSEKDAYDLLRAALDGDIAPYGAIRFEGWPTFNLYLKGEKFEQSLTPTVMKSLIEFQRGIYQAYAAAKFNDSSARLTDNEKSELELTVKVDPGSSDLGIDFTQVAVKLVEQLGAKMTGTEIAVSVVSIAVLWFGSSAWKSYLENRKDIKTKEIGDETQRATLDTLKFTSSQETERAKVMADLAKQNGRIANIERIATNTHTEVVRAMASATYARVEGVEVAPDVAEFLTRNPRRASMDTRLDGKYRLLKLDWSDPNAFKVKVFNTVTGVHLDATVKDDTLSGKYKDALREAEWQRLPLDLRITARALGNNVYRDAVIIYASLTPPGVEEPEDLR